MTNTIHRFLVCNLGVLLLLVSGCEDDSRSLGDNIPPAAVVDLVVGRPLGNSLTVAWTAPGDDGELGQATYQDVRYSKEPITEETWLRATPYVDATRPLAAGFYQGCQVIGLEPSTLYYFAIKAADEAHNWSALSNVVSAVTSGFSDSIPPAIISDLTVDSTTTFTISLSWTAPGDDGMTGQASIYDVRFSILPIRTETDWNASARLIGEPRPSVPGERQSMTVTGLVPKRNFYFAIRAGDEIVNWAPLSEQVFGSTNPAEIIPPAPVTDLTVGIVTFTSVQLVWTAPGDDGNVGRATQYDLRWYNFPITEETWENCIIMANEPTPIPAGGRQTMVITGLEPMRAYTMAMKTSDEIPNWSTLSNVVSFVTNGGAGLTDTTPPARITDLAVIAASTTALTLRWRSVGDDNFNGNAVIHDMRYSSDSITDLSWATATSVEYVLPPRASGTVMTMDIKNLMPGTRYFIAIKTGDEVTNWSVLSNIASGTTLP